MHFFAKLNLDFFIINNYFTRNNTLMKFFYDFGVKNTDLLPNILKTLFIGGIKINILYF